MNSRYVIAGPLRREYILPPTGRPILDVPGGGALYAAAGVRVWDTDIGLLSRVGEDYPQIWVGDFAQRGVDTAGIRIMPGNMDLRSFKAYTEDYELSAATPVAHFARHKLDYPKSLLGYKPVLESESDTRRANPQLPAVGDIPEEYLQASAVHLCPMDFINQEQLLSAFKTGTASTITMDPSAGYMHPEFLKDMVGLLNGVTAFLPSREELEKLYWGKKVDLWEITEELGKLGTDMIVIKCGGRGQMLYDAVGKRRWEVPAYPSRVADPTGSGDAFCGGFLAGYRTTYDPLEATLYGNVSASLNLEGSGAFNALDVMPGLAKARLDVIRNLARRI